MKCNQLWALETLDWFQMIIEFKFYQINSLYLYIFREKTETLNPRIIQKIKSSQKNFSSSIEQFITKFVFETQKCN
jgi:hypothetical protein